MFGSLDSSEGLVGGIMCTLSMIPLDGREWTMHAANDKIGVEMSFLACVLEIIWCYPLASGFRDSKNSGMRFLLSLVWLP